MTNTEIERRLLQGEWYSYNLSHSVLWKVVRVYGDGSFQKVFFDKRTGQQGQARLRKLDFSFPALVGMISIGKLQFVGAPGN